jgi:hypothetical protein
MRGAIAVSKSQALRTGDGRTDGADMRLPDLREKIAQCERRGQMHDVCMVRYVDIA